MKITIEIDTDKCIAEINGDTGKKQLLHIPGDLYNLVVRQLPKAIAAVYRDSKSQDEM